jgi:predicted nucleotidyltransferase
MKQPLDSPFAPAIRNLNEALAALGVEVVLIGGAAVSLLAPARYTRDIDALVIFDVADVEDLVAEVERHGFRPRFAGMAEVAKQARVVAIVHDATGVPVDILLGCMPFEEEMICRARDYSSPDFGVRIATPEDLIIMKAVASRPKDLEDIRTLAAVYPGLDRDRVRHWIEQYGELMDDPNLWSRIEPLLATV